MDSPEHLTAQKERERQKRFATGILTFSILWIVFGPILLTQSTIGYDYTKTGEIGDTIGGITAPIIGLASAILIYLSFTAQIEANRIIQDEAKKANTMALQEANFIYIIDEFERVKLKFENLEYPVMFDDYTAEGFNALNRIAKDISKVFSKKQEQWRFDNALKDTDYIHLTFSLFIKEVTRLDLSKHQREMVQSKIWLYYAENINESFQTISIWTLPDKPEKEKPEYYYKAHQLKYRIIDVISKVRDFEESSLT